MQSDYAYLNRKLLVLRVAGACFGIYLDGHLWSLTGMFRLGWQSDRIPPPCRLKLRNGRETGGLRPC